MGATALRFRNDLIIRHLERAEGASYVVKDPHSGKFFRLREVEHYIAGQLDGTSTLDEIRERTERHFDATLPPEQLDAFVARLRGSKLLETPGESRRHHQRRLIRGSLLYFRVPLLDPDRLLGAIAAHTRWIFTPAALAAGAALCLLAGWITLSQAEAIRLHLTGLTHGATLAIIVGLLLLSVSIHECAHGLACKHFGGAVHEMGFMLIYFQPAFYCNVSDAWLLPEKSKRLWVSFAGIALELTLWALGTITWRLTETGTWPNFLALALLSTAGLKTLLNLSPFLKLDGYYILSDWLDIPNLRRKAFRYVGNWFRTLFGLAVESPMVTTPRERTIFLVYGTVALATSLGLLAYVILRTGSYVVTMHHPGALALLSTGIALKVRRRFKRLFGVRYDPSDPGDDDPPSLDDDTENSAPPPRAPKLAVVSDTRDPRLTRRRLWLGVAAAFGAFLLFGRSDLRIGGPFALLPARSGEVHTAIAGIVQEILVHEGDQVRAGQVIARLDDRDVAVELRKTEAALTEVRANLSKLRAGPTRYEVDLARAGETRAIDRLRFAEATAHRMDALAQVSGVTLQQVDSAKEEVTSATNDLAEARGRLSVLQHGSRPEDIEALQAQAAQLEAQRAYLQGQLQLVAVVNDVDGTVATPERELLAMKGKLVAKGDLIARVFQFHTVVAQIVIPEQEIADIRVGQPVVLRARAYPERTFSGHVTAVAAVAQGASGADQPVLASTSSPIQSLPVQAFLVTTAIDNDSLLLRPGMTGQVKVIGGKHRIVGLITRRLARVFRVEVWSWW